MNLESFEEEIRKHNPNNSLNGEIMRDGDNEELVDIWRTLVGIISKEKNIDDYGAYAKVLNRINALIKRK